MKLYDTFAKALHTPEITKRLAEQGVDVLASTPDELAKVMTREIAKWTKTIRQAGIKP